MKDTAILVIVDHPRILLTDLKKIPSDMKQIDFSTWMTREMLLDLVDVSNMPQKTCIKYQEEATEMQNDESVYVKGLMAWLWVNVPQVGNHLSREQHKFAVDSTIVEEAQFRKKCSRTVS
ncbi:hypothetical protein CDAR_550571 [Caerostris darwini]|uniref:Uncharacterized protein n=1 Tax=Caerostris darwini TaxID=1538125 RepID=A0AAV4XAS4_9ARAC|nr:hypothetical protein CDAR_550571 [Caerostris darwini]